ncbi:MAG: MFS transporter, partial [Actinobacteria bacterium]|nr:MFS transporter [Actinomycetota bacterium]
VAGSALLGTGSVLVLVAINRGNSWGWGSPVILGCAIGGAAALWAFVRTERRSPEPLLPLHWLRTRNVAVPLAISGLMTLTYMGSFLVVPQMLQEGLGYSPSQVGWITIARPLAFALAAPLAGAVALRIGQRSAGMLGGASMALATVLLIAIAGPGPDAVLAVAGLALAGAGTGIAVPSLTALIAGSVDSSDLGVAGALRQLASEMGGVLVAWISSATCRANSSSGTVACMASSLVMSPTTFTLPDRNACIPSCGSRPTKISRAVA